MMGACWALKEIRKANRVLYDLKIYGILFMVCVDRIEFQRWLEKHHHHHYNTGVRRKSLPVK